MYNRRSVSVAALVGMAMAASGGALAADRDFHPNIRRAIDALRAARDDLDHADHDFGGHRKDAIDAIDHAIDQLQVAMRFDRR